MFRKLTHIIQNIEHFKSRQQQGKHLTKDDTKRLLVLPFVNEILGADNNTPTEVVPDFTADIDYRRNTKVDYAVYRNGQPVILLTCVQWHAPLKNAATIQLRRCAILMPDVILGILTDGQHYRFYADLDGDEIIDTNPFLCVDLTQLGTKDTEILKLFHISNLDFNAIRTASKQVKEINNRKQEVSALVQALERKWTQLSTGYVTLFTTHLHSGPLVESVLQRYIRHMENAHETFLDEQTKYVGKFHSTVAHLESSGQLTSESEKPSRNDWRSLLGLNSNGPAPTAVRFADGFECKVGSWRRLFETVALKLNDDGKFHPDTIPDNLRRLVSRIPEDKMEHRLRLSHGLSINRVLNKDNCLKISKRLLTAFEYDLSQIFVFDRSHSSLRGTVDTSLAATDISDISKSKSRNAQSVPATLDKARQSPLKLDKPLQAHWLSLSELRSTDVAPQLIRFTDCSISEVGSWSALFRAVTLKLDAEGHFHPDAIPVELQRLVYVDHGKRKSRRLQLSHGLSILNNWTPSNCLKVSKRLLVAYGYNPTQVYVRAGSRVSAKEPVDTSTIAIGPDITKATKSDIATFSEEPSRYSVELNANGGTWIKFSELNSDQVQGQKPPACVKFPNGRVHQTGTWIDLLKQTVYWLHANDLLTFEKLPVASGWTRYIVNDHPVHPNGKDFRSPVNISGIWLDKHLNATQIVQNVALLLKYCDVNASDVQLGDYATLPTPPDMPPTGDSSFCGVVSPPTLRDRPLDIEATAGCYRNREGVWGWRWLIEDAEVVKEMGTQMPAAFAHMLGCQAGQETQIQSEHGLITVCWANASDSEVSFGPVQPVLARLEALAGDYLFIWNTKPHVSFQHLPLATLNQIRSDLVRVSLLLGCQHTEDYDEVIDNIATALNITSLTDDALYDAIHQALRARNEESLANSIVSPNLSIDDEIAKLRQLFTR